jgi:hypothetical protein
MTKRLYPSVNEVLASPRKGTVQTRKSRRQSDNIIEDAPCNVVSPVFDSRATQATLREAARRNPALFSSLG